MATLNVIDIVPSKTLKNMIEDAYKRKKIDNLTYIEWLAWIHEYELSTESQELI
jgi:hypothetical protein